MGSSCYLGGSKAESKSRSSCFYSLWYFILLVKKVCGDHALFNQKFVAFCMETYGIVLAKLGENIHFYYINPIMTHRIV